MYESPKLVSLTFKNIHKLHLNVRLPFGFEYLLIEDVDEIEELERSIFSEVRQIHRFEIKNSKVLTLDKDTFLHIPIGSASFNNVTIGYAKENSLNFTNVRNFKNSGVYFEYCTFEKLDNYAISIKGMDNISIINSEFKSYMKHSFIASEFKQMIFENNILPCNEDSACDGIITNFVQDLYRSTRGQNMCKLVQKNYCDQQRSKSVSSSFRKLKKCGLDLSKFGIANSCLQIGTESENNAHPHHTLETIYIISFITLLKMLLN